MHRLSMAEAEANFHADCHVGPVGLLRRVLTDVEVSHRQIALAAPGKHGLGSFQSFDGNASLPEMF